MHNAPIKLNKQHLKGTLNINNLGNNEHKNSKSEEIFDK